MDEDEQMSGHPMDEPAINYDLAIMAMKIDLAERKAKLALEAAAAGAIKPDVAAPYIEAFMGLEIEV